MVGPRATSLSVSATGDQLKVLEGGGVDRTFEETIVYPHSGRRGVRMADSRKKIGQDKERMTSWKVEPGRRRDREAEEGSSADKGRGPIIGLRDVRKLMKSLEILTLNMDRMVRRVTALSKGIPRLRNEVVRACRRLKNWGSGSTPTQKRMVNSKTVATQMTPTEMKNIDPIATREELIQDIAMGLGIK